MTLQIFLRPVDLGLFPTTFVQGGFVFPTPRYTYTQVEGGLRYTLDQPYGSTGYYNSDPAITIYGPNLTVDDRGYAHGTVTGIVFSSLNRGTIARLDDLLLPAQDIMQFIEARLAGDNTVGNRFRDFVGDLIDGVDEILLEDGSDALELGGFFGSPGRVDLGDGNDTLTGTAAGDSVIGGAGNDSIDGQGGNDTLLGSTGTDTLIGGPGNDSLNGWYGDDYLNGWTGNDSLHAVYGSDTLDGGTGDDLYSADGRSPDTVQIRDAGGFDTLVMYNFPGTDMQDFVNTGTEVIRITTYGHHTVIPIVDGAPVIEMLRWLDLDEEGEDGTSYDLALIIDQANFTRFDATFAGTDGADTIVAPSGDPAGVMVPQGEIFGNGGDDDITLSGSYLFAAMAGDGNDTIRAMGTQAGWGFGGTGDDLLLGAAGSDTLQGNEGNDTLRGGAGNDELFDSVGDDFLEGGAGDDFLSGWHGSDTLDGGLGDDVYVLSGWGDHSAVILDAGGNDTLILYDNSGRDALTLVNTGTEVVRTTTRGHETRFAIVDGAPVIETLRWEAFQDGELIYDNALALVIDPAEFTRLDAIFAGTDGADVITAPSLDPAGLTNPWSEIYANGGDDDITLSSTFLYYTYGGDGNDTIRAMGAQRAEAYGDAGNDLLIGAGGDDLLLGAEGTDSLDGGDGHDTLYGGTQNDTLLGGEGDDLLGGGAGYDFIDGGAGNDALWAYWGNDTVLGGDGDDLLGGASGDDSLEGGAGDDELWGALGHDTLKGGAGHDTLGGSTGNDSIEGGGGDDVIWGAVGLDILSGGDGADQVGGGAWNDFIDGGAGNDTLYGGIDNDTILGGEGDDLIFGSLGNDSLDGGLGNDTINVGPGFDTVVYSGGADELRRFSVSHDRLVLDDALWGGGLTAAQVVAQFGSAVGSRETGWDFVLDFGGGNSITLPGRSSFPGLESQIDIF